MGRGALVLLLSIGSVIMKVLWVTLLVVLILFVQSEAKKETKREKTETTERTAQAQVWRGHTQEKGFEKIDRIHSNDTWEGEGKSTSTCNRCPVLVDSSLTDCGRCKPNGVQCG